MAGNRIFRPNRWGNASWTALYVWKPGYMPVAGLIVCVSIAVPSGSRPLDANTCVRIAGARFRNVEPDIDAWGKAIIATRVMPIG